MHNNPQHMAEHRAIFEHRSIDQLMAIVKNDLRKFDQEGLIDEGSLIKTVMYCNDKLGIPIREVREIAMPVSHFEAQLPIDFEKLYYVCAVEATNTMIVRGKDPFNNNFDQDILYEAAIDRDSFGGATNYQVTINRITNQTFHDCNTLTHLDVSGANNIFHIDSPNIKRKGKYSVSIKDDKIHTPFRAGMLYMMYIGMMRDSDGNVTFPFHPLITPYYEWTIKEKIISDAIFNSDGNNLGELFKLAQQEKDKAWLDAFDFTTSKEYGYYVNLQRKKELQWYSQYFRYLQ